MTIKVFQRNVYRRQGFETIGADFAIRKTFESLDDALAWSSENFKAWASFYQRNPTTKERELVGYDFKIKELETNTILATRTIYF